MEAVKAKSVRFSILVERFGNPAVYLPLSSPDKDPNFMRAVEENRMVTLKQEPTSKRKEFGVVGYLKEKFVTYLLFPKTLNGLQGQRVIGINYDLLQDAGLSMSPPPKPKHERAAKPGKPEKPKPEPKEFRVRVRITGVLEKEVNVTAMNQHEAKARAEEQGSAWHDFQDAEITAKALKATES
jgi:hypothetical protein